MIMNHQNFSKFLNKRISAPIGIFIIILIAIIAGGIMIWQYGLITLEREGIPPKTVPSNWTSLPESCTKNEDCGTDFCQQKGDKCVEIKYTCENEKCSSTTKEFPNYICENNKCKEIQKDETADWKILFLSPKEAEQWKIGATHTIEINQPVEDFYPFTHLTLNKPNGEEVGIISCKIGTREGESGETIFNWDTKIVLNYCGAGLEEKIKEIEQGTYMIAITKDVEGRPVISSSELFSIVPE